MMLVSSAVDLAEVSWVIESRTIAQRSLDWADLSAALVVVS